MKNENTLIYSISLVLAWCATMGVAGMYYLYNKEMSPAWATFLIAMVLGFFVNKIVRTQMMREDKK